MQSPCEFILTHSKTVKVILESGECADTEWMIPPPPQHILLPNGREIHFDGSFDEWKELVEKTCIPCFQQLMDQKPNIEAYIDGLPHYAALESIDSSVIPYLEYLADYLGFPEILIKPLEEYYYTEKQRNAKPPHRLIDPKYFKIYDGENDWTIMGRCYEMGPACLLFWNFKKQIHANTLWAYFGIKDRIDIDENYSYDQEYKLITVFALGGHLDLIKWIRTVSDDWGIYTYAAAASHGHIHVLKYLKDEGCPFSNYEDGELADSAWPTDTTRMLAIYGHWEELKWAIEYGFPLYENLANYAVLYNRMDMLIWLLEIGSILTPCAYTYAQSVEMLDFLLKKGIKYEDETGNTFEYSILLAFKEGKLDICKWYCKRKFSINTCWLGEAMIHEHFDILRWVMTTKIKINKSSTNMLHYGFMGSCPIDLLKKYIPFMELTQAKVDEINKWNFVSSEKAELLTKCGFTISPRVLL